MQRWVSAATLLGAVLAEPVAGQVTSRVSVDSAGAQANGASGDAITSFLPTGSVSADGRTIAFFSAASNLVAGDTNGVEDVFVRDRQSGTTERVSVDSGAAQGNGRSYYPSISGDGRYVAFFSAANNLVPGDTNGAYDVFVRDRQVGSTERVSLDSSGAQGNANSVAPSISADGRFVAFSSVATNLISGDTNGFQDIFVRDRQTGTTGRVSVETGAGQGNGTSVVSSISADGRYVAFFSNASSLCFGDSNGVADVFVHDRQTAITERVSVDSSGVQGDRGSYTPSISADGRFVAFFSEAFNLDPADFNGRMDVYVRDRQNGTTQVVSLDPAGMEGDGDSSNPAISADGRCVAFYGTSTNLVAGDTNGVPDVFVRDLQSGTTQRVSVDSSGTQGDSSSEYPSISADGRYVVFVSGANNLVLGDTNVTSDMFVHDRDATGFTSLCDPGVGGVMPCPCSNPSSGLGRGCDNSSGTGGAILAASGVAYLSMDSLVFTTSAERPTALSLLAQWVGGNAAGATFGQGVRCTSGTFKRLFSKSAVAGGITVPDFGAGDPSVSARSAAKGDTILAGESRWYVVYYRDNTVLGGCPPIANFNATQTGQVAWSL